MAFNVVFYTFTKKSNSTARPAGGTSFSCNLKSESSVVNPRIELNYDGNPSGFNYAYIAHYNRYYYITDWTYTPGIWTATMSCDVLASYKTEIGSHSLYVLRSSAEYDGNILDTMYPPILPTTATRSAQTLTGWAENISQGRFIVGITATAQPQMGSVTYFVLSLNEMTSLMSYLYGDALDTATGELEQQIDLMVNEEGVEIATVKSQVPITEYQNRFNTNPIDYIVSCIWIPYQVTKGTEQTLTFGFLETNLKLHRLESYGHVFHNEYQLSQHPQAATRGVYLNQAPYTTRVLNSTVFGDVELSTGDMGSSNDIFTNVVLDYISGEAVLHVGVLTDGSDLSKSHILAVRRAQVGVTIQLSQLLQDKTGAAAVTANSMASIISSAMGMGLSAATGNVVGALAGAGGMITSGISAIDSIAKARTPRISTTGSNGGLLIDLMMDFVIYSSFFSVPEEDNEHRGRPLMKKRTPASLGGYMLISEGDVPIPGTAGEQAEVKAYLEGGFYYE